MTLYTPTPNSDLSVTVLPEGGQGSYGNTIQSNFESVADNLAFVASVQTKTVTFVLNGPFFVGDNLTNIVPAVQSGTIVSALAICKTPTSGDVVFRINKAGLPIQSDLLTIANGQTTGSSTTFTNATVDPTDYFTIDVVSGLGADTTVVVIIQLN